MIGLICTISLCRTAFNRFDDDQALPTIYSVAHVTTPDEQGKGDDLQYQYRVIMRKRESIHSREVEQLPHLGVQRISLYIIQPAVDLSNQLDRRLRVPSLSTSSWEYHINDCPGLRFR